MTSRLPTARAMCATILTSHTSSTTPAGSTTSADTRGSPDGNGLAYTGQNERGQFPRLYMAPASNGDKAAAESSQVVEDLDLIPTDLHWGPGANQLRFEALVKGETHIFGVDIGK